MFMWAHANDHEMIKIEDRPTGWDIEYCCETQYNIGTHVALAAAVLVSVGSAAGVAYWRPQDQHQVD
jgi:hypothetical protein